MPTEESLKRYRRRYNVQGPPKSHREDDPEKRIRKLTAEVAELQRANKKLLSRLDAAEDFKDSVFGLTSQDLAPLAWPQHKPIKGHTVHTPILFTSDKQFGEVIRADDMDGMNEFNADIFAERYERLINKTVRWADAIEEGWHAEFSNGIIYLRGGDEISGEIHAELSETNDFGAVPAVRELVRYEREGIRQLKERFGRVHVISIPGNHGRTTLKPRYKGYSATNYETLLAWWLQDTFEREPGITFETPVSGYAQFTVHGWRFELRHGDRMGAGGGRGWIGAPAPITKGHKKIVLDAAMTGSPVDYVLTGHLHTSMQTPYGWANGSFPGYNEMARELGLDPDCAKQWLIVVSEYNQPYGLEMFLSDHPRKVRR